MKSITLRPAKCWSKDGTPKLKKGRCNALSGQGHRAPWSNGGIVISRGKPKERGQKPVYVVFRKHVIRDWITLQLYIFFGARAFYLTMLTIVQIIQHRTIVRSVNNYLGRSSMGAVLAKRELQGHYLTWQLSVGTSCRLVYRINVTHTRSGVAARRDKWQLSD